ncbi:MAG TPA: twin-arginine translocase TatA/TatE family subunit [Chloroflexota bacterium]|jgi:sec-independent protein translocase protein TatA|nr:twin-arginine translocase TatA/TatE family subunit [Chloroflexota bacterium]
MFGLAGHLPELIIVLVIVLLIFGSRSIPGLMKGLGQGMTEFRKATKTEDEPEANAAKPAD